MSNIACLHIYQSTYEPQSSYSSIYISYCPYSDIISFIFDYASINYISSIPSYSYQCKNDFLLNITLKISLILLNNYCIHVELAIKVTDIFNPFGGMSQIANFIIFGIH